MKFHPHVLRLEVGLHGEVSDLGSGKVAVACVGSQPAFQSIDRSATRATRASGYWELSTLRHNMNNVPHYEANGDEVFE